jgi:hypothetical protein
MLDHSSALLLAEVGMQYSAIDDRIVVRPANQFGDLFRVDQAIEAQIMAVWMPLP